MNHVDAELKRQNKKIKMVYLHGHQVDPLSLKQKQLKQYVSLDEIMDV